MKHYVLGLQELGRAQIAAVGGKGAHLGELSRIEGIRVPAGFCVTTAAFDRIVREAPSLEAPLDALSRLSPEPADREAIRARSAEIRQALESVPVPHDLASAIAGALASLGKPRTYAVRSSATAEDLATSSFAGQQDTYLNVAPAAVLDHVRRCWASLFTERAVIYRMRNAFDHRKVRMAVVVQEMVLPEAAGILFTADPVTSNRNVVSVEASFGLGEALVSGRVNPDVYKVRGGAIVARAIAAKQLAIHAAPGGGTREKPIDPERQREPALTDAQVLRLAALGRRIEAHFGRPQDIEWCLRGDEFEFVQSRPITTLFPLPAAGDGKNRLYFSVGHQQMMTDAMKPLGLSLFKLTTVAPMHDAGGRLFVDATRRLASPASRAWLVNVLEKSDPLTGDALRTVLARGDFIESIPAPDPGPAPAVDAQAPVEADPSLVARFIANNEASVAALKRDIQSKTGTALLDFILADIQELRRLLFDPRSHQAIMAGMDASWWLNDQLHSWLGEKNAADTLTQSVANNVTSEMGLALLDVADVIRPYPKVVAFLQGVPNDDRFLIDLAKLEGGREARDAIQGYLDKYGMRCVGEIDITRPRWSERPSALVPMILGDIQAFEPGAGPRRFDQGRREAAKKEQSVLERLRALPDGQRKAEEAQRMIDRVRTFAGYREYPKYGMICRYFVYKLALLREAERLVQAHVLREKEDIFYLTFQELHDAVRSNKVDAALVLRRKDEFRVHQTLTPPRVFTSDGEVIVGSYRRDDVPSGVAVGALVGLPVSSGTVEGRARVIHDVAEARLEPDDILVTAFTDPSWTPLFVAIKGLVTEIGGHMTHGAVIAREYGLPAVVGVEDATRLIKDGQWIRVHGTEGYVELLPDPGEPDALQPTVNAATTGA
ncbi:MAG TPA: rifamycin-inactivating phosphotransferase [Polyangiaceae bacterium]|jgi:phosphoenolpyruvate synthase/pyruvate phosphate dikinase|nr:rifamycin-inactivating phosphotransferase [Polyangiaceae bacterium]